MVCGAGLYVCDAQILVYDIVCDTQILDSICSMATVRYQCPEDESNQTYCLRNGIVIERFIPTCLLASHVVAYNFQMFVSLIRSLRV